MKNWSIESFDIFWIQKNPNLHQKRDRARTSLARELCILSEASDQRVVEKTPSLQKQLKNSSEVNNIVWNRSQEIAESKVRLTLSELLAKTNIEATIVDEIGDSRKRKIHQTTTQAKKHERKQLAEVTSSTIILVDDYTPPSRPPLQDSQSAQTYDDNDFFDDDEIEDESVEVKHLIEKMRNVNYRLFEYRIINLSEKNLVDPINNTFSDNDKKKNEKILGINGAISRREMEYGASIKMGRNYQTPC
ncbi:hypothetical protein RCL_jg3511.t1 [Rhizophagus clarus]|nr:hypothetical protein RCL_jg3511.t1 [Rhizophagus clarus]